MKIFTKRFTAFLLLLIITLTFTACGAKPEATVTNFMEALKQQDLDKAGTFIKKDGDKGNLKYDDAEQEKIVKAIFSKIEYQLDTTTKSGKTAKIKAKITSVDLPKITASMISDLLPTLMSQAFSSETIDQAKQDEMVMKYFMNAINSTNAPKTTTDVEINLVKEKEGWLIDPNDDLLNAMTGNMQKAFQSMQSSESAKIQADPTIYPVGQEAKIGRAAITVTKVERSSGKDYSKPKEGNEFVIVSIKERNIGQENISFNEYDYSIQTSSGVITEPAFDSFGKRLDSGKLAPNGEVEGTITFEVPAGDKGLIFSFSPEDEALLKFKLD